MCCREGWILLNLLVTFFIPTHLWSGFPTAHKSPLMTGQGWKTPKPPPTKRIGSISGPVEIKKTLSTPAKNDKFATGSANNQMIAPTPPKSNRPSSGNTPKRANVAAPSTRQATTREISNPTISGISAGGQIKGGVSMLLINIRSRDICKRRDWNLSSA